MSLRPWAVDELGDHHDLVRAQGDLGYAEPHRTPALGTVRTFADRRRRLEVDLERRPDSRRGRSHRLQARAVPGVGTSHYHLRTGTDRRGDDDRRSQGLAPGGESSHGHLVVAGHVGDLGLRRHARRLVLGIEVPTAVVGSRQCPDDQLRSGPRHDDRDRGASDRVVVGAQHRDLAGPRHLALESHPTRRRPLRRLRHCDHRRTQSTAL